MTLPLPDLAPWRWALGAFCAFMIGIAKTGAPGVGTLIAPLMVMVVGDARHSTAWALPILVTADIFAVWYWRRQTEIKSLFSLIPWVLVGLFGGAFALGLSETIIRHMIGVIIMIMLVLYLRRRLRPSSEVHGNPAFYGIATGFSSTVANAAGPVMSLYLLSRKLSKEKFVATGAWFFLLLNLAKSPIYAWHGLYSAQSLSFDFVLIPLVLCGALTGRWLVRVVPQQIFETAVISLTAASCLLLFR